MAYINKIKSRVRDGSTSKSYDLYDSEAIRTIKLSSTAGSEWKKTYTPKDGLVELSIPEANTATNSSLGVIKVPDNIVSNGEIVCVNDIKLDNKGNLTVNIPIANIALPDSQVLNKDEKIVRMPKASNSTYGMIKIGTYSEGYFINIDKDGKINTCFADGYNGFVEEKEDMNFETMINNNELSYDEYEEVNND